jgi:putative spermidine/putrescine transport system permease protein
MSSRFFRINIFDKLIDSFSSKYLLLPIFLFLAIFFVYPVVSMLFISFFDREGSFTFINYYEIFRGYNVSILLNTLKISAWTTVITVTLAYPVAYYLSTAAKRNANMLMIIVLLPLWTSVLVRAFAWIVLFGRGGVINSTLEFVGVEPVEILFSYFSVIVAMTHAFMPIAVLSMYATMQNIDGRLKHAAATLGAEPGNVFWRVYFPISFPGVASSALVTFILSVGIFIHPALLGSPQQTMIAQIIIQQVDELFNWGLAASISVMVMFVSILFIIIFDRFVGVVSITGAQGVGRPSGKIMNALTAIAGNISVKLSRFSAIFHPQNATLNSEKISFPIKFLSVLILIFLAVPLLFLIPVSFTESPFVEWPPRGFSWQWYERYFTSPVWIEASIRSTVVGIATASFSLLIGVPAAFAINRAKFRGKGLVLPYILMPLVVPNIIIALAVFYFFSDLGLIGTNLGLTIGHTILAVPYVVLTLVAVLQNYDHQLDHAAWTLGAKPIIAFKRITLPLIKVGFITSFLFAFMRSFDEIAIALFVSSGLQSTLPKKLWSEAHHAISPTLAAVSTILIVIVTVLVVVTELLKRKQK